MSWISHSQTLEDSTYRNYAPVFSPDGKHIAYYGKINGNWDVYIIDVNGENRKRITSHNGFDGEPSWSPDGSKMAFTSDRDGNDEIYIFDLLELKLERITYNTIPNNHPTFAPDGKSLIYRSTLENEKLLHSWCLERREERIFSTIPVEGRIRWSTLGTSLTFVTAYQDKKAICRVDTDGNAISLTFTRFDFIGNPHYSDMQNTFVFDAHSQGLEASGDGKWELWSIHPDGNQMTQITKNSWDDWGGNWSPDGTFLAFSGKGLDNTGYEIHIINLEDLSLKQLTPMLD